MGPQEPILLVCAGFPPVRGVGGRRWAKFAKELVRRGHPVHVIREAGPADRRDSLWIEDGVRPGITHHVLPATYPAVISRRPLRSLRDKLSYRFWLAVLPWLVRGNYYDTSSLARRALLRLGDQVIRDHGIRHAIVTGAPFRLLYFATEWKRRHPGLKLVADLRDEWSWSGHYGLASLGPRRQREERAFEEAVITQADRVTTPHKSILQHLTTEYGDRLKHGIWLPHAVDPDDLPTAVALPSDWSFRMIYAGSLYGAEEARHYFRALLDALATLRQENPAHFARCRLDLFITGHDTAAYQQLVQEQNLEGHIHFHAPRPPKEILAQVAASDLVLAFIPKKNKDILGTKFHEVFLLRRPLLHIGEPGLVSRTVVEGRLGDSLRVDELRTELPRIIRGERRVVVDGSADHEAFLLPNVTGRLLNEVLAD